MRACTANRSFSNKPKPSPCTAVRAALYAYVTSDAELGAMLEQGGVNPLQHAGVGFPVEVFDTVVRCSNGIMFLAFRLLARQGPSADFIQNLDSALAGFEDAVSMACFSDPALEG